MCAIDNIGEALATALKLGYHATIDDNGEILKCENAYGNFKLRAFAGNYYFAESYEVHILLKFRGKGYGKEQHLHRLEIAKAAGFHFLIATVLDTNGPEVRILKANNWKQLYTTSGGVTVWMKEL